LEDFLPAELDLIDAQRGGDPTPDILAYLGGPRPVVNIYPGCNVDAKRTIIVTAWEDDVSTGRFDYIRHLEVALHVQMTGEDSNRMRDLAERYEAAALRVLLAKKTGLETVADPVRFAQMVRPDGESTTVDEEQSSGAFVRSVRIPIAVDMSEGLI
jgi:hypothetical protein